MSDETRTFVVVPPDERPHHRRRASRVVVICEAGVLLFLDTDPGVPGLSWWVTPGGGIDPGESPRGAAVRELFEETGLTAEPDDLIGPVAERVVVHGYSDRVLEQHETFFVLRTQRYDVDTSGHTEGEQLTLLDSRWWPLDELARSGAPVWPAYLQEIVDLADHPGSWPRDYGRHADESTVAVGERYLRASHP